MNTNFKLFNTVLQKASENTLTTLSDFTGSSGATGSTGATGISSFITYTTQSEGANTPNPGTTGIFTINGTNLYVWNGSVWVLFSGSASV